VPGLDGFDAASADELRPLLIACLAVPRWVDSLLAARPHRTAGALLAHAARAARGLTRDEILGAVSGHPRIGDRAASGWSRAEQSGVDPADLPLADRLVAANTAYEERFGHIYLVCATGLSGEEVLADLTRRMTNDADVELRVVEGELAKIAVLRLEKVLARRSTRTGG
jgi:2-oxo-4-hydroxy-4-carboxy-5-ureidoimidazoline decarboxylase